MNNKILVGLWPCGCVYSAASIKLTTKKELESYAFKLAMDRYTVMVLDSPITIGHKKDCINRLKKH